MAAEYFVPSFVGRDQSGRSGVRVGRGDGSVAQSLLLRRRVLTLSRPLGGSPLTDASSRH